MKLFKCQQCSQLLFFENRVCGNCSSQLGYLPELRELSALRPKGDASRALASPSRLYRFCYNAAYDACNWLIPAESEETLCTACCHNRTIPDLSLDENLLRWRKFEIAKHRLFYSLNRFGLPTPSRTEDPEKGLVFDFMADAPGAPKVLTGHENGVITINLKEADDAEREKTRVAMFEPYRTLLGHFRHESGHYFWERFVRDGNRLEEFRTLFGDEQQDYSGSLKKNYDDGNQNWSESHISSYAASHPWEDFAETWAHYLHIVDTVETAFAFGIRMSPRIDRNAGLNVAVDFDPYRPVDIHRLVDTWRPLTIAVNSINRAMGEADLYPFVLSPPVIEKLGFIGNLIHSFPEPNQFALFAAATKPEAPRLNPSPRPV